MILSIVRCELRPVVLNQPLKVGLAFPRPNLNNLESQLANVALAHQAWERAILVQP